MYSALSAANSALDAVDRGLDFGQDEDRVIAFSKFIQGISLGYLALVFDQAYIVTEKTPQDELLNPVLKPFSEVSAAAIALLDEAILASAKSFTIDAPWLGGTEMSNVEFAALANSYAARIMAYTPRNKSQNDAVVWADVLAYANNGITSDFNIQGDGWTKWENEHMVYGAYPGWSRADMRIINMLDPSQPARWGNDASFPHPPETPVDKPGVDKRLYSDFQYLSSNNFRTERGYYHFSNYRVSKFDYHIGDYLGNMPEMLLAENDMLRAEAELRMGNLGNAAAIINAGTRISRGDLKDVSASNASEIDMAIHRELQIECILTGLGVQFFDMRKRNMLQPGTALHMPIPASVLEVLQQPFYSFGGDLGVAGEDTSNGGWF
jgi:hypothetical protein